MVNLTGQMGVPVSVIGGEAVIGFDRPRIEALLARRPAKPGVKFGLRVADGPGGVLVGTVRPGGVGARLGLSSGDTITEVNSQPVRTASDMERSISGVAPGNIVTMKFLRGGSPRKTEIVV
jgi:S1-C subfamily serine protease